MALREAPFFLGCGETRLLHIFNVAIRSVEVFIGIVFGFKKAYLYGHLQLARVINVFEIVKLGVKFQTLK